MSLDSVKNFGKASLSAGYAAGVTSIILTTGEGAKFPQPSSEGPFNLVWWNYTDYGDPADDPNVEIVRCTARSTDTLTIIRAQEGTSDVDHNISLKTYKVILALTVKMIIDIGAAYQPIDANLTSIAGLSHAVGDLIYATAATTYAALADVAAGSYLRSGGVNTAPLWSTLILPNAATAYRLPVATGANTIGELAAVGATGQYLSGVTGAIPAWQDKTPVDVRDYSSLNAAITAVGATKSILISNEQTLTGTVASTELHLIFITGGKITFGNYSITLASGSTIDAPDHQLIFNYTGSGKINGLIELRPEWFGAIGDESTNDNTAWANLILSLSSYQKVLLKRKYLTTVEISLAGKSDIEFEGIGLLNSGIIGSGANIRSVFSLLGAIRITLRDLWIYSGNPTNSPNGILIMGRTSAGSYGQHKFDRLAVGGYASQAAVYSIASEVNSYNDIYFYLDGGGAKSTFYTSSTDDLGLGGFTSSTNLSQWFHHFSIGNNVNTADSVGINIMGSGSSGDIVFRDGLTALAGAGSHVRIHGDAVYGARGQYSFSDIRMELGDIGFKFDNTGGVGGLNNLNIEAVTFDGNVSSYFLYAVDGFNIDSFRFVNNNSAYTVSTSSLYSLSNGFIFGISCNTTVRYGTTNSTIIPHSAFTFTPGATSSGNTIITSGIINLDVSKSLTWGGNTNNSIMWDSVAMRFLNAGAVKMRMTTTGLRIGADTDSVNALSVTGNVDVTGTAIFTGGIGAETSMGGFKITTLGAPTTATDAATKAYVDASTNPRAISQSVNMTAAASGSTGITVADSDQIDFGTGSFSLGGRFSLPDWTPTADVILVQKITGGVGFQLDVLTTGYLELTLNALTFVTTSAPVITDGTVHDIKVVVSVGAVQTTVSFYVDGVLLQTPAAQNNTTTVSSAAVLYVLGTSAVRTAGTVSAFRLFNRAFTAAEVLSLYRNGVDFSDKWGSQTSLVISSFSNSVTYPYDTFDGGSTSGFHVVDDGSGDVAHVVTIDEVLITLGKKYRGSWDITLTSGEAPQLVFRAGVGAGTVYQNIANAVTTTFFEYVATATDTCVFYWVNYEATEFTVSNFTFHELGATIALEPEGIQVDAWKDSSTNGLNATYPTTGSSLSRSIPTGSEVLLSTTTVSFAGNGDTTLYTVPTGKRCILTKALVVAGADAGATTALSIGADGTETDFVPAAVLSNLDAAYDSVILQPVPVAALPVKNKSYAAGTVIQAQVATQSGGATNTVYLFGFLY